MSSGNQLVAFYVLWLHIAYVAMKFSCGFSNSLALKAKHVWLSFGNTFFLLIIEIPKAALDTNVTNDCDKTVMYLLLYYSTWTVTCKIHHDSSSSTKMWDVFLGFLLCNRHRIVKKFFILRSSVQLITQRFKCNMFHFYIIIAYYQYYHVINILLSHITNPNVLMIKKLNYCPNYIN